MDVSNCSLTEVFLPVSLCTKGEGYPTLKYLNRADHVIAWFQVAVQEEEEEEEEEGRRTQEGMGGVCCRDSIQ